MLTLARYKADWGDDAKEIVRLFEKSPAYEDDWQRLLKQQQEETK